MAAVCTSDLRRRILITGANRGIGYETAIELCKRGYHVTIACRNRECAQTAVTTIKSKVQNCAIDYVLVDLCSLPSTARCAQKLIDEKCVFDVIILNAGVLLPKANKTNDGFDTTFQVNYLAQYLLVTKLIQSNCVSSNGVTIVALTSILYRIFDCFGGPTKNYDNWWEIFSPSNQKNSGWMAYAKSKFATALMSSHWNRMEGVRAVAVHPGAVDTLMTSSVAPRTRKLLKKIGVKNRLIKPDMAAQSVVAALLEEQPINTYRNGDKYSKLSSAVLNKRNGVELEKLSNRMIDGILNAQKEISSISLGDMKH